MKKRLSALLAAALLFSQGTITALAQPVTPCGEHCGQAICFDCGSCVDEDGDSLCDLCGNHLCYGDGVCPHQTTEPRPAGCGGHHGGHHGSHHRGGCHR